MYAVVTRTDGVVSFVALAKGKLMGGGLMLVGDPSQVATTASLTTAKTWALWARTYCGCKTQIVRAPN